MENLSKHLITSREEETQLMKTKGFYEFASPAYAFLEDMKENRIFNFAQNLTGQRLIWFIKVACIFIRSDYNYLEYEFNDEFTKIRRRRSCDDIKKKLIKQKYNQI